MTIIQVCKQFPTQSDCIKHLEFVRWNKIPVCPYCKSTNQSPLPKEQRYHCNTCRTSFSVTVGTIFHKTKCDLQKWFVAISLVLNAEKGISARQMAREIEVTKDTAWFMLMRIRKSLVDDAEFMTRIIEAHEPYIEGKNKNRQNDKETAGEQGKDGEDKTPLIGFLQRDFNVNAKKSKDATGKSLQSFNRQNLAKCFEIITYEWLGYNGLPNQCIQNIAKHGAGEYVNGKIHAYTLDRFWSLLKRFVVAQNHYETPKYLNSYINVFYFCHNNRDNKNLLWLTIQKSVSL